jgi:hypothetical protein
MKRTPLRRKSSLSRVSRIPRVNRERKSKNWIRAYGSVERVEWVKQQGCVVCGRIPSLNAHTITGGTGRKADAKYIIPLCALDHAVLHIVGRACFEAEYGINLESLAAEYESRWRAHLAEDAA